MLRERSTAVVLTALLVIGSAVITHSQAENRTRDYRPVVWDWDHYCYRRDLFRSQDIAPGRMVFLGDSLIERCDWSALLARRDSVNRGIDGDTTDGILFRLPHVLSLRPRSFYIMVGCNDLLLGAAEDEASRRYRKIIGSIRKALPGTRVYVMELLPTRRKSLNDRILRFNARLRRFARSDGATCIALYASMTGHDGLLKSEYSRDGLHLTDEGYRAWKRILARYIR